MATRPLIILHGWNDSGESFDRLAEHLSRKLPSAEVQLVSIGDYLSKSDDLRFDDLQAALERAWTKRGLPRDAGSADVIVHSTGGLVIRDWLQRHFKADMSPIKHLVMLAPANFGSPLAHVGRSILGRVANGFFSRQEGQAVFDTGAMLLQGLELASPFSWELAMRDRFSDDTGMFAVGRTLCTVLVGNTGYNGIRSVANEVGGDGTVRISTANLNCAYVHIDFSEQEREGQRRTVPTLAARHHSSGRTAFRVMNRIDHSAIKLNVSAGNFSQAQKEVLELIVRALTVEDAEFEAFCHECEQANAALTKGLGNSRGKPGYQNTLVRVRDQFAMPVTDYMIEFYDPRGGRRDGGRLARAIHEEAIQGVHCYQADSSFRSLYIDTWKLLTEVARADTQLGFSITASPMLGEDESMVVGFNTFADEDIEDLCLDEEQLAEFFQPHRTLLVDIELQRTQVPIVFELRDPK
ncbi:hypothetical protein GCM10007160_19350 [Litchfieldella qijiaojingensis]|uniref:Alpha/beta hydrolase n=1 Tax=Litchfieldella qijiaojingensis TaxID=980347 RepID=A0ABQ2YQB7_9GAMM|nr:alpha/beta hydrolase [Halomonas qijiaojingensis]GGX91944.1 hypothetical protein GCM10007160_19350 [Halomonas qijiaojingensis]